MAEYIEWEALDKKLTAAAVNDENKNCNTWSNAIGVLYNLPAADVAPVVHGRWSTVKYNAHCSCGKSYGTHHFLCSVCNHIAYSQPYGLNFCPNCGAKMDGDVE